MNLLHPHDLFSYPIVGGVRAFCSANVRFAVPSLSGLRVAGCRDYSWSVPSRFSSLVECVLEIEKVLCFEYCLSGNCALASLLSVFRVASNCR
jgi:hypothetical protein